MQKKNFYFRRSLPTSSFLKAMKVSRTPKSLAMFSMLMCAFLFSGEALFGQNTVPRFGYLVVADDYGGEGFHFYTGNGDGTFNTNAISTLGVIGTFNTDDWAGENNSHNSFVGDFNNDGEVDYMIAADDFRPGNGIHVYVGNGNGSFSQTAISTGNISGVFNTGDFSGIGNDHKSFVEDFNNDGNLDFMVAVDDLNGAGFHVFTGNGNGTFSTSATTTSGVIGSFVTNDFAGRSFNHDSFVADFNNDGNIDYLVANDFGNQAGFFVYLGNGNGTFATSSIATTGVTPALNGGLYSGDFAGVGNSHKTYIGDFNNDGNIDYFLAADDGGSSTGFHTYLGNGNGTFSTSPTSTLGVFGPFFTNDFAGFNNSHDGNIADFNNDGNLDYFVAADDFGNGSGLHVYLGNGDGTFSATPTTTGNINPVFNTADFAGVTNSHKTFVLPISVAAPVEICGNGIDDDGDGLVDCADPDCFGSTDCCDLVAPAIIKN